MPITSPRKFVRSSIDVFVQKLSSNEAENQSCFLPKISFIVNIVIFKNYK